jgi:PAS domain S-box-containing protein
MAVWAGSEFLLLHNDSYAVILSPLRRESAIGSRACEVWPEVWTELAKEFDGVFNTGVPTRHEDALFRLYREGRPEAAYFNYTVSPIRAEDGQVIGLLNVVEETTARVRIQARREVFLQFALSTARIGAWQLDETDGTTQRTRLHDRLYGYEEPLSKWTEETFLSHVAPEDREAVSERLRIARETETGWDLECRIQRGDGEVRWIWAAAQSFHEAAHDHRYSVGIVQDITERKHAELQLRETQSRLEEADRRSREFLAVLSHELRNPLAPMQNSLHLLSRTLRGNAAFESTRVVLERQLDQLTQLVEDLLDVTRISRGKVVLQMHVFDVNAFVGAALHDLRTLAESAGVSLRFEGWSEPVLLRADRLRLSQVITNLVSNAIKFTPRGGHVVVSVVVDAVARRVTLRVEDDGVGMAEELRAHVFEPFVQAETTLARSLGGLGLGLTLVKGLAEQHGGSVEAQSEGPHRGSVFLVHLPIEPSVVPENLTLPVAAPSSPKRVLIIEDNVDAADTLRDLLAFDGHEVFVAYDGRVGLDQALALNPDVVLCDIGLPTMDGYQVARALRLAPAMAGTRLVALTGYATPKDLELALEAGFDEHLAKPPSLERLEAILRGARERGGST